MNIGLLDLHQSYFLQSERLAWNGENGVLTKEARVWRSGLDPALDHLSGRLSFPYLKNDG